MKKVLSIMLLTITTGIGIANAQKPAVVISDKTGWHKIAETTVDLAKETDEILVIGADKFASIKLKVTDQPIHLTDIKIEYENDEMEVSTVSMHLKAQGETKVINLKGGEREIKKITLNYKTEPNRESENAHVEIWGLKSNADKK